MLKVDCRAVTRLRCITVSGSVRDKSSAAKIFGDAVHVTRLVERWASVQAAREYWGRGSLCYDRIMRSSQNGGMCRTIRASRHCAVHQKHLARSTRKHSRLAEDDANRFESCST